MNNGGQSKTPEKFFPFAFKEVSDISRRKEPIAVVKAKGKKHLTKAEIEEREYKNKSAFKQRGSEQRSADAARSRIQAGLSMGERVRLDHFEPLLN